MEIDNSNSNLVSQELSYQEAVIISLKFLNDIKEKMPLREWCTKNKIPYITIKTFMNKNVSQKQFPILVQKILSFKFDGQEIELKSKTVFEVEN